MTTIQNSPVRRSRPMASDIDVFGLTDQGKVRKENQDQFLIASLHKTMACREAGPLPLCRFVQGPPLPRPLLAPRMPNLQLSQPERQFSR